MRRNRALSILAILIIVIMALIILHYFVEWKIEFETANSLLNVGSDNAERNSENTVILSGTEERYQQAKEALQYIFDHICK